MDIRWIERTDSTNRFVKEHDVASGTMVLAREQTAGRGQRGNSWESEPGANLTFSFALRNLPVAPAGQFAISEAVSLAFVALLADYGIDAKVKWPNDIYVGDRKICGILIENSIMGSAIARSVVGAGLNVNQTLFLSDAPNPTSMSLESGGKTFELKEVATKLALRLDEYISHLYGSEQGAAHVEHSASLPLGKGPGCALHSLYLASLYRGDGRVYRWRDVATGEEFLASIDTVAPSGHLHLSGRRPYAFKEVAYIND